MFDQLINRWWIIGARGLVAVFFGVAAFLAPDRTLTYLVSLFGLFALADAIFTMGAGLATNWLSLFLEGVGGGAIGFLTLFFPTAAHMWFSLLHRGVGAGDRRAGVERSVYPSVGREGPAGQG
jgi:uncharacterized membrane protein HdeD (DUF308 family)